MSFTVSPSNPGSGTVPGSAVNSATSTPRAC